MKFGKIFFKIKEDWRKGKMTRGPWVTCIRWPCKTGHACGSSAHSKLAEEGRHLWSKSLGNHHIRSEERPTSPITGGYPIVVSLVMGFLMSGIVRGMKILIFQRIIPLSHWSGKNNHILLWQWGEENWSDGDCWLTPLWNLCSSSAFAPSFSRACLFIPEKPAVPMDPNSGCSACEPWLVSCSYEKTMTTDGAFDPLEDTSGGFTVGIGYWCDSW